MQKLLLTSVVAGGLMASGFAYAQPVARTAPPVKVTQDYTLGMSQWLIVGASAVVGGWFLDAIIPDQITYFVLGGIGGYLALVWYNGGQVEVRSTASP